MNKVNKSISRNPAPGRRSPWGWIPTLYLAEGLPYFAVNTLTVLMYTNLGISKTEMAFFTGWLYLPWVIKPFWSPFVDLIKTKRWWTLSMQLFIAILMALVVFALPTSHYFQLTLIAFWLMAFCSATHDIAADGYYMLELNETEQAAYVGIRSTFYRVASVLGQGGLVILAGHFEQKLQDIPMAWAITFAILSAFFLFIFFWDVFYMPRPSADKPIAGVTAKNIFKDFGETFVTFFQKKHIWIALTFMLLYRLPEALCLKLVQPFLIEPREVGGLALSTSEVGFVNGTIGVVCLLAGGVAGGLAIAKGGLRKWLWPMACALTLPCLVYCFLAQSQTNNFILICTMMGIEQFGYGFGFTAFMLYLMYFSRGKSMTSHYAFCTAFMALGMMIPGMAAGWIFEKFRMLDLFGLGNDSGYVTFFWLVILSCIATFLAVLLVMPTLKNLETDDNLQKD